MVMIGFTMFRRAILEGQKRQTIRVLRKTPIKLGGVLHLYWKPRTKWCHLLGITHCTETFNISMDFTENWLSSRTPAFRVDRLYGDNYYDGARTLLPKDVEDLARSDGFADALTMLRTLTAMHRGLEGKVFQVIRWSYPFSD